MKFPLADLSFTGKHAVLCKERCRNVVDGTRDAFSISGVAMGSQGFGSID